MASLQNSKGQPYCRSGWKNPQAFLFYKFVANRNLRNPDSVDYVI